MHPEPSSLALLERADPSTVIPVQATSDEALVALWLHGRPATTRTAYIREAGMFLAYIALPLRQVRLGDFQAWTDGQGYLAPASQGRRIGCVKSLFSFAHRLGYVPFNVGAAVRTPKARNVLAQRIMTEADVHRMLALEPKPRNRALLVLLYAAGLRASEATALRWSDLIPRDDAGQISVQGKGGKDRVVLLVASTWALLQGLRGEAGDDRPVFPSGRGGGAMGRVAVHRIVKLAAKRAGLAATVWAHWLRHAHVSHALDRGAPAHLVQATVGHASLATTSRYAHAPLGDSSARYLGL